MSAAGVNVWDFNDDKAPTTGQSEVRVLCQEPVPSFMLDEEEESVS